LIPAELRSSEHLDHEAANGDGRPVPVPLACEPGPIFRVEQINIWPGRRPVAGRTKAEAGGSAPRGINHKGCKPLG
jgi:hypothetical protein